MVSVCSTVADHLIVQMSCQIREKILWIVYYTKKGAWISFAGFVKGQFCGSITFLEDSRDMSKYQRLSTWKLSNHMEPNSWTKLFPKHTRYSCRHIWTSTFHSAALANLPNTIWLRCKSSAFLRDEHICVVTDVRFLIIEFMKIFQYQRYTKPHGSQSFLNHNEAIFAMERLNTSKKSKKVPKREAKLHNSTMRHGYINF